MANAYAKSRIRRIASRFGLIPLRTESVASLYRNNAVVRVRTAGGAYALKPFYRSILLPSGTVNQIRAAADHIRLLMNSGFPYMPEWLASRSGKLWTLDQGRPFYVTAWVNGRQLAIPDDYEQLGRALAALHTTSAQLLPAESPLFDHFRLWQHHARHFRSRMATASRTHPWIRRWYRKFGESCSRLSDRTWMEMKSPEIAGLLENERVHPALIHGDITSQNVIIADDGRPFIIDWDRVKTGSAYVEVATALMNTTCFNPDFIFSLLKGYEELHPLNRTERKWIAALYRLPREAWYAARFPRSPRSRAMLEILERTWPLRLKAMDLLEEWANRPD